MTLRRNYDQAFGENQMGRVVCEGSRQQYEILLQFDLKREKQKNLILQERLRNKEIFIQQMKHFQQELTVAYEQCKNELILAQQKIQYLQTVQFRDYAEQIADLKHMLLSKNCQQSKRESVSKEDTNVFSSLNNRPFKNRSEKDLPSRSSDRRNSKTHSNVGNLREKNDGNFEEEVQNELKKVSNFISHFLQMTQFYLPKLKGEAKFSRKLKNSWKWVKDVVKQWDQHRQALKNCLNFKNQITKLFNAKNNVQDAILLQIIRESVKN